MTQPIKPSRILPAHPSSPLQQVKEIYKSDENTQARHVAAASGAFSFIRIAARSLHPIPDTFKRILQNPTNYCGKTGSLMCMVYLEQGTTAHIATALQKNGIDETRSNIIGLIMGSSIGAIIDPFTIDRNGPLTMKRYFCETSNAFFRNNLSISAFFYNPFEKKDGRTNAFLKEIYPGTVFAASRVSDCIGLSLSEKLFDNASKSIFSSSRIGRCVAVSFVYGTAVAKLKDAMKQHHQ